MAGASLDAFARSTLKSNKNHITIFISSAIILFIRRAEIPVIGKLLVGGA
jgi:hypothetical protein